MIAANTFCQTIEVSVVSVLDHARSTGIWVPRRQTISEYTVNVLVALCGLLSSTLPHWPCCFSSQSYISTSVPLNHTKAFFHEAYSSTLGENPPQCLSCEGDFHSGVCPSGRQWRCCFSQRTPDRTLSMTHCIVFLLAYCPLQPNPWYEI